MNMKCPFCESNGTLHEVVSKIVAHPLPGVSIDVALPFIECRECGEEFTPPGEIKSIDLKIKEAKLQWLAENIENNACIPVIVRELRSLLNVTQREFSEAIGATGNSVSKYESGTIIPTSMAKRLIVLLALQPELYKTLKDISKRQHSDYFVVDETRAFESISDYMLVVSQNTMRQALSSVEVNAVSYLQEPSALDLIYGGIGEIQFSPDIDVQAYGDLVPGETNVSSSTPQTYPGFFKYHQNAH